MKEYQQRVVTERDELVEKVTKLRGFMDSTNFDHVDGAEQQRLKQQYGHMELYLDVLNRRIAAFV